MATSTEPSTALTADVSSSVSSLFTEDGVDSYYHARPHKPARGHAIESFRSQEWRTVNGSPAFDRDIRFHTRAVPAMLGPFDIEWELSALTDPVGLVGDYAWIDYLGFFIAGRTEIRSEGDVLQTIYPHGMLYNYIKNTTDLDRDVHDLEVGGNLTFAQRSANRTGVYNVVTRYSGADLFWGSSRSDWLFMPALKSPLEIIITVPPLNQLINFSNTADLNLVPTGTLKAIMVPTLASITESQKRSIFDDRTSYKHSYNFHDFVSQTTHWAGDGTSEIAIELNTIRYPATEIGMLLHYEPEFQQKGRMDRAVGIDWNYAQLQANSKSIDLPITLSKMRSIWHKILPFARGHRYFIRPFALDLTNPRDLTGHKDVSRWANPTLIVNIDGVSDMIDGVSTDLTTVAKVVEIFIVRQNRIVLAGGEFKSLF